MAYRCGNRDQMELLSPSIEQYVSEDDPVRVYDAFIEALDFHELGIDLNPHKVGNAAYDPRSMLKLLVYGYSYGVKSSRKLERECYHNISFNWLMGGLRPDHKTIAEFRRRNRKALQEVLRPCARVCIRLELIDGNILFVDGTKIRANASRRRSHGKRYYRNLFADIDRRIEQLFADCEETDRSEEGIPSYVTMDRELTRNQNLKERIRETLGAFTSGNRKQVNQTDPECAVMSSVQGSHACYNVQSVVDDEHGMIVHAEAVSGNRDVNQFARQIEQASELLDGSCHTACADAGYAHTDDLAKIDREGIKVIVPSQRQALHEGERPFSKSRFRYDPEHDCYYCPEGHRLNYQGTDRSTGKRHYQIGHKKQCHRCSHYGQCTTSQRGRKIKRLHNEAVKLKLEAQYEKAASQEIYARRKTRVEHPFGHIKRNLKTDAFLLRGRDGVQAETSLLATCFNIARMMTICGVRPLLDKLTSFKIEPTAV